MDDTWNKQIIAGVVKHFKNVFKIHGIQFHFETALRSTNEADEKVELRILQAGWRQIDATHWETQLAINLLCTTVSGENAKSPVNLYRIEEIIGICQYELTKSFSIEGFGCVRPADNSSGMTLDQFRPRQIDAKKNIIQASTTGYYTLEKESG